MIKKITCAMALAMAMSSVSVPAAYADDRPFVAKLFSAMIYAQQVVQYRTTDREEIRRREVEDIQRRHRESIPAGAGIRG